MPIYPPVPNVLQNIQHFVVLMFENRSFDHLLGYELLNNPDIDGLLGTPSNFQDPADPNSTVVPATRATAYGMPFDPGHEFPDIALQLYAPGHAGDPLTMGGFVFSAMGAGNSFADASRVMEAFQADQIPALTALARQFAVVNSWHASLPGPTWPNRFFLHAATSGGLTDSPSTAQILQGFDFPKGTLYERLEGAAKQWRIYHDGLPQSAGVDWLRPHYILPVKRQFRDMTEFQADVAGGDLPEYTLIEPRYDTGHSYLNGNSMHPMNDIRAGEGVIKSVYEALRQSPLWASTMLIVTFDEHGGFFDHVPPPAGQPTGDDLRYRNPKDGFDFDRLGVRVPAIVVSAYTQAGSVIGQQGGTVYDHTSVLKTVEQRFGLAPLTQRDAAASTLEAALNLPVPRTDAPLTLPAPLTDTEALAINTAAGQPQIAPNAPLSDNQQSLVDLALKCNLDLANPALHDTLIAEHAAVQTQSDAEQYLMRHDSLIDAHRM